MESLGQPTLHQDDFSEEVISQILQKGAKHSKNNLTRRESDVITHVIHVVSESPADHFLQEKLGPAVIKPCKICGDVVGDHYTVKKHSYVDPSTDPYMCGICRQAFDRGYLLKIHLEVEHGFVEQDSNRRSLRISRRAAGPDKLGGSSGSRKEGTDRRGSSSNYVGEINGPAAALSKLAEETGRQSTTPHTRSLKFVDIDSTQQAKADISHPSPDTTILLTSEGSSNFHEDDTGGAGESDGEEAVEQLQKTRQCKNGDLIVINLVTEGGSDSPRVRKSNRRSQPEVNAADRSRYKCDFCNLGFPSQKKRGIHIKQDHPGAQLKCPVCESEFSERRLFNVHLKTHKKEKPPPKLKPPKRAGPPLCTVCGKTFLHESGLQIHTQNFHPEMVKGQRGFCCEQCGSMFWTKNAMVEHQKIHSGNKPFVCSYCKKAFCRRSDLKAHTRVHTGEKPHACTQCDKTFRKRLQLANHLLVHSGQRPYKCDMCAYACRKRDQLMRHRRTHTQERPYPCSHCEKSFKTNGNLRDHIRTHTGDRPFKCPECEKAFAQYTNLVHHRRTHTGLKPYACDVCQSRFARSNNLRAHMKTHESKRSKVKKPLPPVKISNKTLPPVNVSQPVLPSMPPLQGPNLNAHAGYDPREQSGLQMPSQDSHQQHRQVLQQTQQQLPRDQITGSVIINATEILASVQSALQFEDLTSKLVDIQPVSQQQQQQGGLVANLCSADDNYIPSVGSMMGGGQVATLVNSADALPPGTGLPGYGSPDNQCLGQSESITVVGLLSNMSDFQNSGLGSF